MQLRALHLGLLVSAVAGSDVSSGCESRKPAQKNQEGLNMVSCGDGCYAKQKSVPLANGCGTGDITLPKNYVFTMACQFHDVCYARCVEGQLQKQCDDMYCKLMSEIMLEKMPSDVEGQSKYLNEEVKQWEAMDSYHAVRGDLGSAAFRSSVNGFCECSAEAPADVDPKWVEFLVQDIQGEHDYDGMNSSQIYNVHPKVKETIQKLATRPAFFDSFLQDAEKWACDREPGTTCSTDQGYCRRNQQGYCNTHLSDECTCLPNQCGDKGKKICTNLVLSDPDTTTAPPATAPGHPTVVTTTLVNASDGIASAAFPVQISVGAKRVLAVCIVMAVSLGRG